MDPVKFSAAYKRQYKTYPRLINFYRSELPLREFKEPENVAVEEAFSDFQTALEDYMSDHPADAGIISLFENRLYDRSVIYEAEGDSTSLVPVDDKEKSALETRPGPDEKYMSEKGLATVAKTVTSSLRELAVYVASNAVQSWITGKLPMLGGLSGGPFIIRIILSNIPGIGEKLTSAYNKLNLYTSGPFFNDIMKKIGAAYYGEQYEGVKGFQNLFDKLTPKANKIFKSAGLYKALDIVVNIFNALTPMERKNILSNPKKYAKLLVASTVKVAEKRGLIDPAKIKKMTGQIGRLKQGKLNPKEMIELGRELGVQIEKSKNLMNMVRNDPEGLAGVLTKKQQYLLKQAEKKEVEVEEGVNINAGLMLRKYVNCILSEKFGHYPRHR